ncbi:MAG: hypothetical protein ACRDPD_17915, partial [Streptosporangiaceae bacterium]
LRARPGLLLGDPALAAWLVRTAKAAGDRELAASVTGAAESLAAGNPGFPALAAAAAHSRGLASQDPGRIAEAAARHPDPWARASAAEDLGVLRDGQGDREQAIRHLKEPSPDTAGPALTATRPGSGTGFASSASGAATGSRPPAGP